MAWNARLLLAFLAVLMSALSFGSFVRILAPYTEQASTSSLASTCTEPHIESMVNGSVISSRHVPRNKSNNLMFNQTDLGTTSQQLPSWIMDYIEWHQLQRQILNESNWQDFRFLIIVCEGRKSCGGTSDRLKPLALFLFLAQQQSRILLISWQKPCALEALLLPNVLNWSFPDYLLSAKSEFVYARKIVNNYDSRSNIVKTRMQRSDGGESWFVNLTSSSYADVYRDLFQLLFQPAPGVAQRIETILSQHQLTPSRYAVAHYRAFYNRESPFEHGTNNATLSVDRQVLEALNAVRCASLLQPGSPVYFASDSTVARVAIQDYAQENLLHIVVGDDSAPVHLDEANGSIADHYSTFVDLYLMAFGSCSALGHGGFGQFANLIGYNATCSMDHMNAVCDRCG